MFVLILSLWKQEQTRRMGWKTREEVSVQQRLVLSMAVELIFNGSQYFRENEAFFSAPQHNFLLPELNQRIYYVLIPRVEVFLCWRCAKTVRKEEIMIS